VLPARFSCIPSPIESVHLWSWWQNSADVPFYASLLSAQEQQRLQSMTSPQRQREFICGRGGLRWLLSYLLQRSPQELEIIQTASGKPVLANSRWQFNLSHSQGLVLCAIAEGVLVGVDVEYRLRSCPMERVMRRWAKTDSFQAWQKLPQQQQSEEFWRWWTQHEAIAKALGIGISRSTTLPLPHHIATCTIYQKYIASVCTVELASSA
jgi:4'-phosphopantetheinyl transferase